MNKSGNKKLNKGISIIEILVVIAVVSIVLVNVVGLTILSLRGSVLIKKTTQADALGQEAMEAVRNFRDGTDWEIDGLGVLATGIANPYHPENIGDGLPGWMLVSGQEIIDDFTREIIFEKVFRDGNDDIVESGVTDDSDTKKVTVIVSWENKEVKLVTFFTNWRP